MNPSDKISQEINEIVEKKLQAGEVLNIDPQTGIIKGIKKN